MKHKYAWATKNEISPIRFQLTALKENIVKNQQLHTEDESLHGQGLCMNCDDSSICKIRPDGQPVIYCEEYNLSVRDDEKKSPKYHSFNTPIDFGIKL